MIRAAILILYLVLIGLIPNAGCFSTTAPSTWPSTRSSSGDAIDVAHVRERSRLHPRCGTGFLIIIALVSVGVFAPLGLLPPRCGLSAQIVLVPVVAAVSYEIIRALVKIRTTLPGGWPLRAGAGDAVAEHAPSGRCADRGCDCGARCRSRG